MYCRVLIVALTSAVLFDTAVMAQQSAPAKTDKSVHDLRYFSSEDPMMIAVRPQELLAIPKVRELATILTRLPMLQEFQHFGIEPSTLKQVAASGDLEFLDQARFSIYLDNKTPIGLPSNPAFREVKIGKQTVIMHPNGAVGLWQPSAESLVVNDMRSVRRFVDNRTLGQNFMELSAWKRVQTRPVAALVKGEWLRKMYVNLSRDRGIDGNLVNMLGNLVDEIEWLGIGVSVDKECKLLIVAQCSDSVGAKNVESSTVKIMDYTKKQLQTISDFFANQETPWSDLLNAAKSALETQQSKVQDNTMMIALRFPLEVIDVDKIASSMTASSNRQSASNNLREIALGILNFESAYKKIPQSKMLNPGSPQYSWRVALLPWLGLGDLYKQYNLDEPWDSENNLKLLDKMPSVYRHPNAPSNSTTTSYVVLVGKETAFPPEGKVALRSILDGTSNTIAVVEAKTEIPWTKPQDLEYSNDGPLPELGGYSPDGFNAAMIDGAVRFIEKNTPESVIRAMLTINGGETISP